MLRGFSCAPSCALVASAAVLGSALAATAYRRCSATPPKTHRVAFVMSVNKGKEAEYERRHSPIPDELAAVLKGHGVHNYSIFLHPDTNQLFGYAEIESEERWAEIANTPECKRWWKFMGDVMPSVDDGSNRPVATSLREVFHLQ